MLPSELTWVVGARAWPVIVVRVTTSVEPPLYQWSTFRVTVISPSVGIIIDVTDPAKAKGISRKKGMLTTTQDAEELVLVLPAVIPPFARLSAKVVLAFEGKSPPPEVTPTRTIPIAIIAAAAEVRRAGLRQRWSEFFWFLSGI